MFDIYYDKVTYEEKETELDRAGHVVYKEPREINVRLVAGGEMYMVDKDGQSIKYTKEYQIPFMVKSGDKIDDRLVVNAHPAKDVFGSFHYCIAKVV